VSEQQKIVGALQRRFGMMPERAAELRKFNEEKTDWYRTCRTCGKLLTGSIADLKRPCTHVNSQ